MKKRILDQYFLDGQSHLKKQLRKYKLKVTDERVIDYDSPTGKGYVGIAKSPLQKVDKGFGFKGVLMQTDNRALCQCHLCGKWFRVLTRHLTRNHKTNQREYCQEFGLDLEHGLVSDDYSYLRESAAHKLWANPTYRRIHTERLRKQQPNAVRIAVSKETHNKRTIEQENRYGTCNAQIRFRLIEYIKQYKDLPSRTRKGEGGRICNVLRTRHGSLNKGFESVGLPVRYRAGTAVELKAPNGQQLFFNYNKPDYNKQKIYQWMVIHCPILSQVNTLPTKEDTNDQTQHNKKPPSHAARIHLVHNQRELVRGISKATPTPSSV